MPDNNSPAHSRAQQPARRAASPQRDPAPRPRRCHSTGPGRRLPAPDQPPPLSRTSPPPGPDPDRRHSRGSSSTPDAPAPRDRLQMRCNRKNTPRHPAPRADVWPLQQKILSFHARRRPQAAAVPPFIFYTFIVTPLRVAGNRRSENLVKNPYSPNNLACSRTRRFSPSALTH